MSTGIEKIAAERQRQVDVEGYDAQHDHGHARELIEAASRYTRDAEFQLRGGPVHPGQPVLPDASWPTTKDWPWAARFYKPSEDPRRNLEKAGALLAAAIDAMSEPVVRAALHPKED